MPELLAFPTPLTRQDDLRQLQDAIPEAVASTVETVGLQGFIAFFDGYRDSVDLQKIAA